MSVLDKLQSNLNLAFKLLKGFPGEDVCWVCGLSFRDTEARFCDLCETFVCPSCGSCYCSLSESTKHALDAEMFSIGLWEPFYHNPPKRKRRKRG